MNNSKHIFDIFDYEKTMQVQKLFDVKITLMKHGWLNISLECNGKINDYRPNTYCYPLDEMIESALFSLQNKDNIGEEYEFSHDAEQDGFCYWDLKIVADQKLKLLIRLNPHLILEEEITELGLDWMYKYHLNELEILKEDIFIAIEIECLAYAKEILRSIHEIAKSVTPIKYKKSALAEFPVELLKDLEDTVNG